MVGFTEGSVSFINWGYFGRSVWEFVALKSRRGLVPAGLWDLVLPHAANEEL